MRKSTNVVYIIIIILIMLASLTQVVQADVGPKPSLTIKVRGLDTENYWLDLLITGESKLSWLDITDEERARVVKLAEYKDEDGYHPALLGGSYVPMIGEIKGKKQWDGSFIHKFGYLGIPSSFKIAILTEDGRLIISDIVERREFKSYMVFDLNGHQVTEALNEATGRVTECMSWNQLIISLILCLLLTWMIEIFIAKRMGFRSKESRNLILLTNVLTQIILNIIVFILHNKFGYAGSIIGFITGEVTVFIIEIRIYMKYLQEKSIRDRVWYAVLANLISVFSGLFIFLI